MNSRKISAVSGLLRNSTKNRFAIFLDSDSARRKPPETAEILSCGPMIHDPLPSA